MTGEPIAARRSATCRGITAAIVWVAELSTDVDGSEVRVDGKHEVLRKREEEQPENGGEEQRVSPARQGGDAVEAERLLALAPDHRVAFERQRGVAFERHGRVAVGRQRGIALERQGRVAVGR